MNERLKLGELLVETGLIRQEDLDRVLLRQKEDPRRIGVLLVEAGVISEYQVTQVLSQQLSVPWVALQHIDFSRQLLNLVPTEIAEKYGIVPIYVRRSRHKKETLYVAMEDPSDLAPLGEIEAHSGLPVRPMIAPPSDIRAAIRAYYLGLPPEEELTVEVESVRFPEAPATGPTAPPAVKPLAAPQPATTQLTEEVTLESPAPSHTPSVPPRSVVPHSVVPRSPAPPAPPEAPRVSIAPAPPPPGDPVPSRGATMPRPRGGPQMVTLTMLDGTQIALPRAPGRRKKKKADDAGSGDELTARDLIDALRAQAGGADTSEVLGKDVNWERMFAALLSLLLKKHLIYDWEFVRELKR